MQVLNVDNMAVKVLVWNVWVMKSTVTLNLMNICMQKFREELNA